MPKPPPVPRLSVGVVVESVVFVVEVPVTSCGAGCAAWCASSLSTCGVRQLLVVDCWQSLRPEVATGCASLVLRCWWHLAVVSVLLVVPCWPWLVVVLALLVKPS